MKLEPIRESEVSQKEKHQYSILTHIYIQKMMIMASGLITSWDIDVETVETVSDYFGGLQNHCRW